MSLRIGQGIDIHQLAEGIPLIIGSVTVPYPKGPKGHSDGDPLLHALVDALLGAIAEGDIGSHFPSSDPKWKSAHSRVFLTHAMKRITARGFCVTNADCTVLLQQPVLNPYIPEMRRNIANILETDAKNISVKATTTDHLGFIGSGEGISALATVLLKEKR